MAETAGSEGSAASASKQDLEVVLSKATDSFDLWQQLPAWVLGGAAILGGAALIAFPIEQALPHIGDYIG